ncbi:hypothetical protein TEA_026880 [Camellia sinensis var. sinensis]|uniref:Uncharacterized protein n=1 Tax=Camellia sinensis var. sinensis TaxID=542762 RepID=A0A4V3WJ99_CAMSN|nr:hypothetical protein TEA_026880 [Camellia sinensis var. sinensis]
MDSPSSMTQDNGPHTILIDVDRRVEAIWDAIEKHRLENVEIDEREATEIILIKKFEDDDEEVKQEKNVEVSQELLMTELSSLDYYDSYEIAKEGDLVKLNEKEEIKDEVIKLTCAPEKLIGDTFDIPRECFASQVGALGLKHDEAEKRAEAAARKVEAHRIAEQEEKELEKASRKPDKKANRVSIPVPKVTESELQRQREAKRRRSRTQGEEEYEKIVLVANTNRDDSIIEARSVEGAIAQMAVADSLPVDRHPISLSPATHCGSWW